MGGAKAASTTNEQRGPVLDVLRDLLERGQLDAVLELVAKLVARNSELERKLADLRSSRRTNEGVSSAQLALLLEALSPSGDATRDEADTKLRDVAAKAAPERKDEGTHPRLGSRRSASRCRPTCAESPTRSSCRRKIVRARGAAVSVGASGTT